MHKVLTIAGSDSCGGAGIQADLKSFTANGVFGMSVITAITAQNTQGVLAVQNINLDVIAQQIEAIYQDIKVSAVKIGMLSQSDIIEVVTDSLLQYKAKNIIVDPVMISKSGYNLLAKEARDSLKKLLLPIADLITPNLHEVYALTGIEVRNIEDMKQSAKIIYDLGVKAVLIKGGHLQDTKQAIDILFDGQEYYEFSKKRIISNNNHGTGCSLSSAIAAWIAQQKTLPQAVSLAKDYISQAITHGFSIGKGVGVLNHLPSRLQ